MAIKNAASVGQAINLAAADARENKRESDVNYIYKRFVFWTDICDAIQSSDIKTIQEVIDNRDFDDIIKRLKETLEK